VQEDQRGRTLQGLRNIARVWGHFANRPGVMMDLMKWPLRISRKALINRNGLIVQKKPAVRPWGCGIFLS